MRESARQSEQSSAPQELFELLSRQRDQDLGDEETQRLTALEAAYPDAARAFRQQIGELNSLLQRIPVVSMERLLFETPPLAQPQAIIVSDSPMTSRRSGSQRVVVATVTSLLCAGLLFAMVQKTETRETAIMAKADVSRGTMEAHGGFGGAPVGNSLAADVPLVAESLQMKVAGDVPSGVLMGAAAPVHSESDAAMVLESPVEADVQPLIQSDDWNVVVVRIDAENRDQAMEQIQSIVKKAGLQLKGSVNHAESRWLGVVLASTVAGREDVVSAMEGVGTSDGYVTETPQADSAEALFVAAARESLKHPTRSELHHGKVFVALPSAASENPDGTVVAATEASPKTGESESVYTEPSTRPSAAGGAAARSARISAKVVPDVTLVVFEFSDSEKSGPNGSAQRI